VHAGIGKKLGFEPGQIQDHMFTTVGYTGTPHSLMMLVGALEDAKPGDKILVASHGNGSDALLFEVTEEIEKLKGRKGIKKHLASKRDLNNYAKYTTFREIHPVDVGVRGEIAAPTAMSALWRNRRAVFGLVGSKCKQCGTPQFPPQRICVKPGCGAVDEMEPYRFSDKKAKLFTYTGDNLAFSMSPPEMYGMVDFEGGGRYPFNLTGCELDSLKVDMPVEMSFRRTYHDQARGIHGYFWKATPVRG
jgi:uncharacterized OB-fold protein